MGTPRARRRRLKRPPVLYARTQALVARLERSLGASFLSYWNSANGSVHEEDVKALYAVLSELGRRAQVALFIKSGGGSGQASLQMVHLLRAYADTVVALVPLECQSAATMLALGADEIRMGPLAHLSAVDTSLTHDLSPLDRDNNRVPVSLDELLRVANLWQTQGRGEGANPYHAVFQYVHPLVIGAVHRASSLSTKLCEDILAYHMKDARAAGRISARLNGDYPSHTYPITFREARRIGLNVTPMDAEPDRLLFELNELYSEMGQHAQTDFDDENYHDNEIRTIIEGRGMQVFYQVDKDWHYRKQERRWVSMNDDSGWKKAGKGGRRTDLYIR